MLIFMASATATIRRLLSLNKTCNFHFLSPIKTVASYKKTVCFYSGFLDTSSLLLGKNKCPFEQFRFYLLKKNHTENVLT